MSKSYFRLSIDTPKGLRYAMDIVAELTRNGIIFIASREGDTLVVELTGGY